MGQRRWIWAAWIAGFLLLLGIPISAQEPVTLDVVAGYDTFFRPDDWLPLRVQVRNDGASVTGRLTVRPETSGRAVNTAFSTPIDLPTGSEKTAFLYIQANRSASTVIVELITDEGVRVTETAVTLRAIDPQDALHVVLSGTAANSLPLNNVASGGYSPRVVRWQPENVPLQSAALRAIDTLIAYDVDSETLSLDQRNAIDEYITFGGHLIVIGGPAWAQTSAAFSAWLAIEPAGSANLDDLAALADFVGFADDLAERTPAMTGDLREGAQVLAGDDDLPLLARSRHGIGTVDVLTVDPTLAPLRGWQYLPDMWLRIMTSTRLQPAWQRGILDTQESARALAILPGVNLLPPVTNMIAFIAAYILLIGPVNYWVLSRIRRRAWAWATIPLFIAIFSGLAWTVGFNLRGSEVIASRIYVTHIYADSDLARQQQLLGILSPRRETYTLSAPNGAMMQVLPGLNEDTLFQPSVMRSTADVQQAGRFSIEDVAIDGGVFANFGLTMAVDAPAIGGSVSVTYDTERETSVQTLRGIVRNDSDIVLEDAILLARNQFYRLPDALAAGDVLDFDSGDFTPILVDENDILPQTSAFAMPHELIIGTNIRRNTFATANSLTTSRVVLNIPWNTQAERRDDLQFPDDDPTENESRRRALLRAFLRDQFGSMALGNDVYLIGWSDAVRADDIMLENVPYRPVDTSLYIVQLETRIEDAPRNAEVTITPDQFSWHILQRDTVQVLGGLDDLTLINPAVIDVQLTPLDGAVLSEVDAIEIVLDRSSSYGRSVEAAFWNWEAQRWDALPNNRLEEYLIENASAYAGPDNAMRLRFTLEEDAAGTAASARLRGLRVSQIGRF